MTVRADEIRAPFAKLDELLRPLLAGMTQEQKNEYLTEVMEAEAALARLDAHVRLLEQVAEAAWYSITPCDGWKATDAEAQLRAALSRLAEAEQADDA